MYPAFRNPEPVTIRGYNDHAMEPFITRDGRYLFFNNSNDPTVNTNLHYAQRIDDLTFEYKGEIAGVNTPALEGVPTMDRDGGFYFVSTRSYKETLSTVYRGRFSRGVVSDVELVPGISEKKPRHVNFDAEVSASGDTLYFVDGIFSGFAIYFGYGRKHSVMARRLEQEIRKHGVSPAVLRLCILMSFSLALL